MNNEKQDFHDWAISKGWYLYCKQPELWITPTGKIIRPEREAERIRENEDYWNHRQSRR